MLCLHPATRLRAICTLHHVSFDHVGLAGTHRDATQQLLYGDLQQALWGCLCNHMCTKHSLAGLYVAIYTTCWDFRAKPFARSIFSRRWLRGWE